MKMALGTQRIGMRMVMSINSSCERHGGVKRSLKTILGLVALVGELGLYPEGNGQPWKDFK